MKNNLHTQIAMEKKLKIRRLEVERRKKITLHGISCDLWTLCIYLVWIIQEKWFCRIEDGEDLWFVNYMCSCGLNKSRKIIFSRT